MQNNHRLKRHNFLQLAVFTNSLVFFTTNACTLRVDKSSEIDEYGGWKEKTTKTGFFHTKHDGGRWWFVMPKENAFLSFGISHYHTERWVCHYNQPHRNKNMVQKTLSGYGKKRLKEISELYQ